ncbi:P-loop containing nucleoside triphosphate hydrolase protein [Pisolithus croceorrhizus]|nr:P-loop containing nucleoside triphosphate hydrolase protein [Pisolithus croceorrhizus]
MGTTGTGKSSFIANATKREGMGVGHSLISCTSEIKATKFEVEGSSVVLVDTPGFNGTNKSDREVLKLISDWLNAEYKTLRPTLSAIFYFHRISDNRMAGTPLRNLRAFEKLCGKNAMSKIILVTTMWDEVDADVGAERLKELKDSYWKVMISQGSTTFECEDARGSPIKLLRQIGEEAVNILLQEEISTMKLEIQETAAGQQLCSRLEELAEKRMEMVRKIREETKRADEKNAEDLWREYSEVKNQLDSTLSQARELKMNPRQHTMKFLRTVSRRK